MNTPMTIGTVARMTDISVKTIRYYEEAGFLPSLERTESGYRRFTANDVRRLRLIRRAKILGVSLREIKRLVSLAFTDSCQTFEQRLAELVDQQLQEIDRTMAELGRQKDALREMQEALGAEGAYKETCRADQCECCRFIDD
ncbi:MAG TPA: MerR family transcriptional regulator [Symbiobacteriaceae bacterium]|jgi:DNA-binding transcriptional MerR regulator